MDSIPAARQQGDRESLLLAPSTTTSVLTYRCHDVDSTTEVALSLDTKAAGNCPLSGDAAWGPDQRLILKARVRHLFVLGSTRNPPASGDWNGDGKDEIGVYRPSTRQFYLDLDGSNSATARDAISTPFGAQGDLPLSGRW